MTTGPATARVRFSAGFKSGAESRRRGARFCHWRQLWIGAVETGATGRIFRGPCCIVGEPIALSRIEQQFLFGDLFLVRGVIFELLRTAEHRHGICTRRISPLAASTIGMVCPA
jgi:hypothetical protein